MSCWKGENKHNKSKFTSKFENILDVLLCGSGLSVRGGEATSQSTKQMALLNDYESTSGRILVLMLIENRDEEPANIEFKKAEVQDSLTSHQKSNTISPSLSLLHNVWPVQVYL
jgi:hypothetical protein